VYFNQRGIATIFRIISQNPSLNSVCKLWVTTQFTAVVERCLSVESQGVSIKIAFNTSLILCSLVSELRAALIKIVLTDSHVFSRGAARRMMCE